MKARREASAVQGLSNIVDNDNTGPADILAGEDEEDVIF